MTGARFPLTPQECAAAFEALGDTKLGDAPGYRDVESCPLDYVGREHALIVGETTWQVEVDEWQRTHRSPKWVNRLVKLIDHQPVSGWGDMTGTDCLRLLTEACREAGVEP